MRVWTGAVVVGLLAAGAARAQTAPLRFHWQKGQVLTYRVEQSTAVAEAANGLTVETSSRHNLTKRWEVLAVDDQGVATLQLSLTAMRMEQTRPDGEKLLYDSADPGKSDPALKEQLGKFLNQPLAVLKVDPAGRVIAVVKGPPAGAESEGPFVITLPPSAPSVGQSWERTYKVVLAPPQGTGEQYDAVQKFVCRRTDGAAAVFELGTSFPKMPESQLDQVPLLQKQPQGEVVFDAANGRLQSARLVIDRELRNHRGSGSSYRFRSTFTEQYVPGQ